MDDRSSRILKTLIQRYLLDGQPVGSKSLANSPAFDLSSATIRSIMADLENMGFVTSPHTSAGRIPTTKGLRLFIDTLLKVNPINESDLALIEEKINNDLPGEVIADAADLLSNLSKFAGFVSTSKKKLIFRQVEFLQLNDKRLLLILVTPDGEVLNKILRVEKSYSPEILTEAGNYLTKNFAGLALPIIQNKLSLEVEMLRKDLSSLMLKAVEEGGAVLSDSEGSVVISGEKKLFNISEISYNVDRLRNVYQLLEQKSKIIKLLDSMPSAQGVKIFIGGESSLMPEEQLTLVASRFVVKGKLIGTLGVIGPTRMAYERVIPIVDLTARMVSSALAQSDYYEIERKET